MVIRPSPFQFNYQKKKSLEQEKNSQQIYRFDRALQAMAYHNHDDDQQSEPTENTTLPKKQQQPQHSIRFFFSV